MNAVETAALSAAIASLVVFMLRTWIGERLKKAIQYEYDQKLTAYKAVVESQSQQQLEILRNDLSLKAKLKEIEKAWIHERMAKALFDLNDSLYEFRDKVTEHVTIFQGVEYKDPKRYQPVIDAYHVFSAAYRKQRILLPDAVIDKIESFVRTLMDKSQQFQMGVVHASDHVIELDTWMEIDHFVKEEGARIHHELQSEFKKYIGIESHGLAADMQGA